MAKPTLKVTLPDGTVAKRRTDREYTHVVIDRGFTAEAYRQLFANEIAALERNIAEYRAVIAEQGDDHWRYQGEVKKPYAYSQWIAECEARIEHYRARDPEAEARDAGYNVTWHQRWDLALKEASRRQWLQDVQILPVEG